MGTIVKVAVECDMARYSVDLHKQAYEYWKQGFSVRKLSQMTGFPTRRQLTQWKSNYPSCRCPYHNWEEKLKRENRAGEEAGRVLATGADSATVESQLKQAQELLRKMEASDTAKVPALASTLLDEALLRLEPADKDSGLSGDLGWDMQVTAYMMLARTREALARITVQDVYQASKLLRDTLAIIQLFRPVQAEPDEVKEEIVYEISFGLPMKLDTSEEPEETLVENTPEEH